MKILLPKEIETRLIAALNETGDNEIGGVLMGEHVSNTMFRIMDLTIQRYGGTQSYFLRVIEAILGPLNRFFQRTRHKYTRYNYLGEWHSHPSFLPLPSPTDRETMWDIVEDPGVGANFAILLIVRLRGNQHLEGTATVYMPYRRLLNAQLVKE